MLAPFGPHIAEEMWELVWAFQVVIQMQAQLASSGSGSARREELEIPVQVNGKLRSRVIVSPDVTDDELRAALSLTRK